MIIKWPSYHCQVLMQFDSKMWPPSSPAQSTQEKKRIETSVPSSPLHTSTLLNPVRPTWACIPQLCKQCYQRNKTENFHTLLMGCKLLQPLWKKNIDAYQKVTKELSYFSNYTTGNILGGYEFNILKSYQYSQVHCNTIHNSHDNQHKWTWTTWCLLIQAMQRNLNITRLHSFVQLKLPNSLKQRVKW